MKDKGLFVYTIVIAGILYVLGMWLTIPDAVHLLQTKWHEKLDVDEAFTIFNACVFAFITLLLPVVGHLAWKAWKR